MASINAPPRQARPMVGKLYRVQKAEVAQYTQPPPKDTPLAITNIGGGIYNLTDGTNQYSVKSTSVLTSLLKSEADKLRKEMAGKLVASPVGGGGGFTAGTDPEVFCVNKAGSIIPAFAFLPSKKTPTQIGASTGHTLFYDGFQAEFTTPPVGCHEQAVSWIRSGLLNTWLAAKKIDPTAILTHRCVLDVPEEILLSATPEQVALGCDPSKNAYRDEENPRLQEVQASQLPFRFAGFHIHVGVGNQNKGCYKRMVKLMDAIAGVASVSLFQGMEDERRRWYYGLAGEYRTPKHGLEWRVMSSAAMCHPGITHLVLDISRMAARLGYQGFNFLWETSDAEVQDTINSLNVEQAQAILKRNERVFMVLLRAIYGTSGHADKALRVIRNGARNCLNVDNMTFNWQLEGSGHQRFREMAIK